MLQYLAKIQHCWAECTENQVNLMLQFLANVGQKAHINCTWCSTIWLALQLFDRMYTLQVNLMLQYLAKIVRHENVHKIHIKKSGSPNTQNWLTLKIVRSYLTTNICIIVPEFASPTLLDHTHICTRMHYQIEYETISSLLWGKVEI